MLTTPCLISDMPWLREYFDDIRHVYAQGKLSHALLISGVHGLGKYELAQTIAQLLLCIHPTSPKPCETCKSCTLWKNTNHPDMLFVTEEEKLSIGIDTLRNVIDELALKSHQGTNRVIHIHHIEKLTIAASNALLKILEEPPNDTFFIATSDNPGLLLTTIRSRFTHIRIYAPQHIESLGYLSKVKGIDKKQAQTWLPFTQGAPLAVAKILSGHNVIVKSHVLNVLMFSYDGAYTSLINVITNLKDFPLETTLEMFASYIHDLLVIQTTNDDTYILHQDAKEQLLSLAKRCNSHALFAVFDHIVFLQKTNARGIRLHVHSQLHALALEVNTAIRTT